MASKVDVGFVEECEPWKLHSRFFPSKIGGKPAWLNLKDLPQPLDLQCSTCREPCIFLCQIYAPIDDNADAFHRTIFVFICKSGLCCKTNKSNNFKIFRCQLKRENLFYSFEPPVENTNEEFNMSKWPPLCRVCGAKGPNHCGKCKSVNYCSRPHQVLDWKNGHKEKCLNTAEINIVETETKGIMFPEWELITEEESQEETTTVDEEKEMELFHKLVNEKKAGTLANESEAELEQYSNKTVEDKAFGKFKKKINKDPGQVLRYDRGGNPLWIASQPIPSKKDIPKCHYCSEERQFEFQVMPQLLNFLDIDLGVNSIDWGVLSIYTCKNNCSQGPAYKNEYIFKQDIIQTVTESE